MRSSEHRRARAIVASLALVLGCTTHRSAPLPAPPPSSAATSQVATASWYGPGFHGRRTASGERFDANALSAAHPTLPFGTHVRVTNLANGRCVRVRVTDRGPFAPGRSLDVSYGAARALGMVGRGTARVRMEVENASTRERPARRRAVVRSRRGGRLLARE